MEKTTQQLHSSSNRIPKAWQVSLLAVALVLQLFLASPVNSCKEEDKNSLLGFLDGLSLASALNTSWKIDTNCCLWEGITCNMDGAVMDISLASMGLEGHISPSLGNLTNLLRLNLSGNSLSGELPPELLWSSSIVVLDVSFNKLNGEFHNMPSTHELSMKVINISSNFITGYFPSATLDGMKNLATLNMSNNSFTGKIPSTVCVGRPFFVVLDLSYNQFHGVIPPELGNCSMLRVLKAGHNQLSGRLPAELFNITSLGHLSFPNNLLHGKIDPDHVVKLRKLIVLDLGGNSLNGKIPDSIGQLKMLEELHMDYNNMSGELPPSLSNCSNLTTFIIRGNNFHGKLTNVNFATLPNLILLDFRLNKFTGTLPESLYSCSNLIALRLSYNRLHGQFSTRIRNIRSLKFLAVSHNNFTNIANTLRILSSSTTLSLLILGGNFKHETMPDFDTFYGFENLKGLAINDCSLHGNLPKWLSKLKLLQALLLNNNQLSGPIPAWINTLNFLFYIDMSNNRLRGDIPVALMEMPMLEQAKSDNFFPATIVFWLPLYLSPFLQYRATSGLPRMINLGYNKLTGVIPPELGQLKELLTLNLSFNNLYGEIPESIGNLANLQVLDLSHNNLTGAIPSTLEMLHFLSEFNISNNDMVGPIPTGGQFITFPDSSFVGNPKLCTPTLVHHGVRRCSLTDAAALPIASTEEYIDTVIFVIAFGIFFGVGVLYDQMVLSRYIYVGRIWFICNRL